LRDLQGLLGDYNTLVDKLNTDTSFEDFESEYSELQAKNSRKSKELDEIFLTRQQ
jgi:intraflagellar transport protein 74